MRSIKYKILAAFLVIISVLTVSETFFVGMHFVTIKRYQDITDNMVAEYQIIENTASLISSFNDLVKYVNDQNRLNKYNQNRADLLALLGRLNKSIATPDGEVAYIGLKNTVLQVVASCDDGVAEVHRGDLTYVTSDYNNANHQNTFVRENTATLILKQLQYTETIRNEIIQDQVIIEIIGILFFLAVILGCVWYSFIFSRQLITPLARLTRIAKMIEDGDLTAKAEKDLTKRGDEIASLANSFNAMVNSLKANIRQLKNYNETLIKTKKIVTAHETEINQLQEINRLKDEFLNIVTHELKTPLIPIVGLSEVMTQKKQDLSPELQNYAEIIHKEAEKLSSLIRQILTAARSNSKEQIPYETFQLDEFIQSNLPALLEIAKRTDSKIEIKISSPDLEITSDKNRILQVIYNLVDNAVKYGNPRQTIIVAISKPDDRTAKIEIIDQGKGIPPDLKNRLFIKFSQLEPAASRSLEGMGLGLYLCKQAIDDLGGQIGLTSELGKGSDFYFTLPLSPKNGHKSAVAENDK